MSVLHMCFCLTVADHRLRVLSGSIDALHVNILIPQSMEDITSVELKDGGANRDKS